jgi:hypothetical protein
MPLAKLYHEPLFDGGRPLKLATVEVRKTDDTHATLYSSASAGTTVPNPTQADALGNLLIWTHEVEVKLVVTPVGGTAGAPFSVRTTLAGERDAEIIDKASEQTITATKTVAPADKNHKVTLAGAPRNNGGTAGIDLIRAGAGALCINFVSGGTTRPTDWAVGLDLNETMAGSANSDLVLGYDSVRKADVLRMRSGPFLALGNTAMPITSARCSIVSNGIYADTELPSLKELLRFEIGDSASGITHLIKAATPGAAFGVTKAGWVAAGTDTPAAPFHAFNPGAASSTNGDGLRLQLNTSTDPGHFAWTQGTGTSDWRLGRVQDGTLELALYSANGAAATPAAPGTEVIRFRRNGRILVNNSLILGKIAAPADTDLTANQFSLWWKNTAGAAGPQAKGKDSGGTVVAFDFSRQAAVASPTGGTTVDTEARAAIDALRARLQTMGVIAA